MGKKGREEKGREGDPRGKSFSPLGKKSAAPRKGEKIVMVVGPVRSQVYT